MSVESIITENLDIWTSAIKTRSASGRGSSNKIELYGIKRLRDLILDLAVRGKLVEQVTTDGNASQLLSQMKLEKEQIAREGKFSKLKSKPIAIDKYSFEIPSSWQWCLLDDIVAIARGGSPRPIKSFITEDSSGLNWIKISDSIRGSRYISSTKEKILREGLHKTREVFPGDLILSNSMSFGYPYIMQIHGCIHDGWLVIRTPAQGIDKLFLSILFQSPYAKSQFTEAASGAVVQNLNADKVRLLPVPLPPEAEQKRIVAKVDELMALCDQLESQTEASIEAHQTLVKSLLETLTNAKDAEELNESWQRISEHFDVLFTTEDSIDQLKQTILQLAVMGKLVKQDPSDEPASKLLERIAAEKEQLIKNKKIKKQKPLPPICENEKPFQLPHGWEWTRFSDFVNEVATGPFGSMIHKSDYIDGGIPLINPSHMINGKIQEDSAISVNELKAEELSSYKLAEGDLVMARRGEMGRSALVTKRENNWLCGTGSFVLKFNDKVSREFLLLLFKTDYVRNYLGGNSVGSTMTNLNHGILNKMPILIPPVLEQERVVQKVKILFGLCEKLKLKINETQLTKVKASDLIGREGLSTL